MKLDHPIILLTGRLLITYIVATSGIAMAGLQETHFRKNLAIMGGLLMLAYSGPGKWALGKPDGKPEIG